MSKYPQPRSRKERIARIAPDNGELTPNDKRTHDRCPDYKGFYRDTRGCVIQIGGWVHKPWTNKPPLIAITGHDIDEEWQVPYNPHWQDEFD